MTIAPRWAVLAVALGCWLGHGASAGAQVFELITSFTGCTAEGCPDDGDLGVPGGPMLIAPDGFFYGALVPDFRTPDDLPRSRGAVYRVDTAGRRVILHRFDGVGTSGCFAEFTGGSGALTVGADGAIYGVASACGAPGGSTIFRIAGAAFEVVHEFPPGGFAPLTIAAGPGGAFYGIGSEAGTGRVIYEWNGALRVLAPYEGPIYWMVPDFVRGPDGNLY